MSPMQFLALIVFSVQLALMPMCGMAPSGSPDAHHGAAMAKAELPTSHHAPKSNDCGHCNDGADREVMFCQAQTVVPSVGTAERLPVLVTGSDEVFPQPLQPKSPPGYPPPRIVADFGTSVWMVTGRIRI
ncbi:MAG: hypothetical protein EP340_06495 [Alphaproteobacteria bacterium]|nr:MAG: hypothetical protein EP340_06495 [Alphaproteobacteria bacterium]